MSTERFYKTLVIASIILFAFIIPAPSNAAGEVLISEIMYDLSGSDADREWIEIYNSGSGPVTIIEGSGDNSWRFNDGSNHILTLIQGSLVISPGGVAVFVSTSTAFLADHPGFSGTLIDTTMSLNNTSDTLKLSADKGATFFGEVTYQNTWGGNGDGKSLEKIDLNGNNEQSNWRASTADGGTPGSVSGSSTSTSTPPVSPPASSGSSGSSQSSETKILKAEAGADVFIEKGKPIALSGLSSIGAESYKWYLGDGTVKDGVEITYTYQFPGTYLATLEASNSEKTSIDQLRVFVFGGKAFISEFFMGNSSTTGQWLEIYNPNNESLDLSGWILSAGNKNFIIPPFVVIPKGGFLVFSQQATGLDLSSSNKISVKYPSGLVADEVDFEKNVAGSSANRTPEGFFWSKETTPGRQNIVLSSGSGISDLPPATTNRVVLKSDEKPKNYISSFYSS
ncbi:MAG: lamin tail domain-containing protein, partial [Patescibacteria group bacterium]